MTKFWASKTFWVNLLAAVALFTSSQYGVTLSAETTGLALVGINMVLRVVTNDPLEWQ
jgi:uncharacterized membrane protein